MNSFYEHHRDSIHWHYRCFDRILLNGLIQPFQQPERVIGFFNTYRQLYPVTRYTLSDIADQFQRWVTERAEKRNIPIVEAPKGRRDAEQDHRDLRSQGHQAISRQAANRDRGHEPAKPDGSQSLSQRLHQAIRSRSLRPRATTSTVTASTRPSKICLSSKNLSRRSTIITSTSSRTFWKPLSIAASCESSRNRPSHRPESAFRASSSTTLGNSH